METWASTEGQHLQRFGADYESHPGVIHGGIVATVLDEVMSQAIYRDCGLVVYTVGLRVRYGQPLRTGIAHVARAQVTHSADAEFRATARVDDDEGDLVAASSATFYPVPEDDVARVQARLAP